MRAKILHRPGMPLGLEEVPVPQPGPGAVVIWIAACGVCQTDLHVIDGDRRNRSCR